MRSGLLYMICHRVDAVYHRLAILPLLVSSPIQSPRLAANKPIRALSPMLTPPFSRHAPNAASATRLILASSFTTPRIHRLPSEAVSRRRIIFLDTISLDGVAWPRSEHRLHVVGDGERRLGLRPDLVNGDAVRKLDEF